MSENDQNQVNPETKPDPSTTEAAAQPQQGTDGNGTPLTPETVAQGSSTEAPSAEPLTPADTDPAASDANQALNAPGGTAEDQAAETEKLDPEPQPEQPAANEGPATEKEAEQEIDQQSQAAQQQAGAQEGSEPAQEEEPAEDETEEDDGSEGDDLPDDEVHDSGNQTPEPTVTGATHTGFKERMHKIMGELRDLLGHEHQLVLHTQDTINELENSGQFEASDKSGTAE